VVSSVVEEESKSEEKVDTSYGYQVAALALQREGAIEYFEKHLPVVAVGVEGKGHAEFYAALCSFYQKTGADPVDKVSFKSWLQNETLISDALGGEEGVTAYLDAVTKVDLSTPEAVTGVIRFRHSRQQQQKTTEQLTELVQDRERNEEDVEKIDELVEQIRDLNRGSADPLAILDDGNTIAERAESMWELPNFLPSPFPSLNRAMGYSEDAGFCKGAVHAVLAASGKGKSTFAKCLMNHWVDKGNTVLYVNYEEAKDHWEKVLFTQITKQNTYLGQTLSDVERKHHSQVFRDKMEEWNGRFIVNHDPETAYFEDLEIWIRSVVSRRGSAPDVIIFDTIQSMFLKGSGKNLPRWGQYEIMMVKLEKLAKDLECVIIITAQENSNRMKEKREVVQQSDTGGSLAIVQKSAITIFITDAKSTDETIDENIMQLQIPKNRITGVAFMMDPPLVKYEDKIKSYVPYELVDNSPYDASVVLDDILNPDGDFH